jgi:hypothetical protein
MIFTSAQGQTVSLQPGVSVERTLARGQSHSFNVSLEQDQYLQLVVDQHGIDVVVRVVSPADKTLGQFDSPNGTDGPENVSLVSATAGVYRIDVSPLGEGEEVVPGRFEIRILELRAATAQELQAGQNQEALKTKGLQLLAEVADKLEELRLPQTRVRSQLQAAQLLWTSDEKLAGKLIARAIEEVREYLAQMGNDNDDEDYYQSYAQAMQLRMEVLQALGPHDPEMALAFLRSTSTLAVAAPDFGQGMNQRNQELQFELSLANLITAKDPKRALQIAEDTLKKGYSFGLLQTIDQLQRPEPELAAKLAKQVAAKLQGEKLLRNQEASHLAINLLMRARVSGRERSGPPMKSDVALLSDQEYRDLFDKVLAEALAFTSPANAGHSIEKELAQNILNSLKSMPTEMAASSVGNIAAVEKKLGELKSGMGEQRQQFDKYYQAINTSSTDAALEVVSQAPREMRDQLYQNLAQKAVRDGDFERAAQIIKDRITNPSQRRHALFGLAQQTIQIEASKGRVVEALRIAAALPGPKERAMALIQVVNLIGSGQKIGTALSLLEQARNMVVSSPRIETQEQMAAMLEIGRAFSRYDSKRAFEVVEPLLDQFNEMSTAALALNGFGQQYYQDGELMMQNGNGLANTATALMAALGTMGMANFDRAKAAADRLERPEVRIGAYLSIAQQAINPTDRRIPLRW